MEMSCNPDPSKKKQIMRYFQGSVQIRVIYPYILIILDPYILTILDYRSKTHWLYLDENLN